MGSRPASAQQGREALAIVVAGPQVDCGTSMAGAHLVFHKARTSGTTASGRPRVNTNCGRPYIINHWARLDAVLILAPEGGPTSAWMSAMGCFES